MHGEAIELDEEIAINKKIVFKSVYGKASGWKKLCPVTRNGVLLGVKPYTEEEKRKVSPDLIITAETTYKVQEDGELDLGTELGQATWDWLKYNTEDIASDLEHSQVIKGCLFYIHSEDVEVTKEYKRAKEEKEALDLIFDASHTKLMEVARLLGNRMDGQKPNNIATYLYSICKTDGGRKRVIGAFNDDMAKIKIFLYRGIDTGIIKKGADESYKFGNLFLGMTEGTVLEFLANPSNTHYVGMMRNAMLPKKGNGVDQSIFELTEPTGPVAVVPAAAQVSSPNEFTGAPEVDLPPLKPEPKVSTPMTDIGGDDMGDDSPPPFTGKKK